MHTIKTEIEIDATPERIWSILTDFSAYPQWNPFIRSITGEVKTGERLTAFIEPSGGKGMTFGPTVLIAQPNQELRWLGHFLLPNIFDGEHYFQIEPISAHRTRFIQGENFSGLLVMLAQFSIENCIRSGFIAMNQALKIRAEDNER
jgi:hypothetical protein